MNKQEIKGDLNLEISLTKNKKYKTEVFLGQGYFVIGTLGLTKEKCEVLVEATEEINWDAFNGYYVPASWPYKDQMPYGDWPRYLYYYGNDEGFIKWSKKRKVESFWWNPYEDKIVDFTNSQIEELSIQVENRKVVISLGANTKYLKLHGNLENIKINKCNKMTNIFFYPEYGNNIKKYKLPIFDSLKEADRIIISVPVACPPFDCESLLQFSNLKDLTLEGNMTNLIALEKLEKIEEMRIRNTPNLTGFPPLNTWKNLKKFYACGIERIIGLRLRKEAKELKKTSRFNFIGIHDLKSTIWFETKYGIPFEFWEEDSKKIATKAYKKLYDEIRKIEKEKNIKISLMNYIQRLYDLDKISDNQKKDVYSSIVKIIEGLEIKVDFEKINQWLKETNFF